MVDPVLAPMIGRARFAPALVAWVVAAGCDLSKPGPAPPRPAVALAIHRPDAKLLVFSGEVDPPGAAYDFAGAPGSVRVTMEVDGIEGREGAAPIVNDVLFKAVGNGRITIELRRPTPDHPDGRVTIQCLSGEESSSAFFEPRLWYHLSGAIVALEPAAGDSKEPVAPGKEIILGRYVARNIPRDLRLSFKAIFTREPVAPRTKAAPRPPR